MKKTGKPFKKNVIFDNFFFYTSFLYASLGFYSLPPLSFIPFLRVLFTLLSRKYCVNLVLTFSHFLGQLIINFYLLIFVHSVLLQLV